jgi:ABC-type transporter Mla subunit MlaD
MTMWEANEIVATIQRLADVVVSLADDADAPIDVMRALHDLSGIADAASEAVVRVLRGEGGV